VKLEKWTLIVESVGTIAIVASLIVLVLQVRDNTQAMRTGTFDAVTQSINDWRNDLLDNPELFELYHNYKSGVIPSADQEGIKHAKLLVVLVNMFTNYDRAYIAYQNRLDSDEWNRIRRGLCLDTVELRSANDEMLRDRIFRLLTNQFVAYIEANCN